MEQTAVKHFIFGAIALILSSIPSLADAKFEDFIQSLWPQAKEAGLSRALFDRAFSGITEPDRTVLKLAANQPEFTSTTSQYLAKAITPIRLQSGREALENNKKLLAAIEAKYGVSRYPILAIWGMESNFGKDKGSMKVMRSLATLMYHGVRRDYAREQFVAACKILASGAIDPEHFTGSWAAALGHTQFIPTSYLAMAVDWNGDGHKDIWNNKEDALASTANYLAKAGWQRLQAWGWEITLPAHFDKSLIGRRHWKTIAQWRALGIRPATQSSFNISPAAKAFIMIPQSLNGPAFLITHNFLAIYDYNQSHSYALAVAHMGDLIAGSPNFVGHWPDTDYAMNAATRSELQRRLSQLGFDTGGDDGRFGARTFEAIIAYEKTKKLPITGQPSLALLERLRKNI